MNTSPVEFDQSSLDAAFGVSSDSVKLEPISTDVRLHQDDRQTLESVGSVTPTGITTPEPVTAPAVPDYLAPHMPPAPAGEVEPAAPVDWNARWQAAFGSPEEGQEVTRDTFERRSIREYAKETFLEQHPDLSELRKVATGAEGVNKVEQVQKDVEKRLKDNRLFTPEFYDQQLAGLVKDGQLTQAGETRFSEIKDEAAKRVKQIDDAADSHANTAETNLFGFYEKLETAGKDFKPFGIELDASTQTELVELVRSGAADAWLSTNKSPEEAVNKALLLAMIASPSALAELAQKMDSRGQEYGINRRLAAKLAS